MGRNSIVADCMAFKLVNDASFERLWQMNQERQDKQFSELCELVIRSTMITEPPPLNNIDQK